MGLEYKKVKKLYIALNYCQYFKIHIIQIVMIGS